MKAHKPRTLAEAKREGNPAIRGRLLRINDVIATTGLSRATIYRLVDAGSFPKGVHLTTRAVGWREAEVEQWLEERASVA